MMADHTLDRIVRESKGRFITVTWVKDNGELRTARGRIGTRFKGKKASHRQDSADRLFFLLYVPSVGFRRINVETITSVKCDGLYIFNEKALQVA